MFIFVHELTNPSKNGTKHLSEPHSCGPGRQATHQPMAGRADGCNGNDRLPLAHQQDSALHGPVCGNLPPAAGRYQRTAGGGVLKSAAAECLVIDKAKAYYDEEI